MSKASDAPAPPSEPNAVPPTRRLPWGSALFGVPLLALGAAALVLLFFTEAIEEAYPRWDFQITQMLLVLMLVLAAAIVGVWLLIASFWSRTARVLLALGVVAGAAGLATVVALLATGRLQFHVSGDLRPQLAWRRDLPAPPPMEAGPAAASTADVTPTDHDFPQFLGPDRNGVLDGVTLLTDWQASPPEPLWRQPIGGGWSAFAAVGNACFTMEQRGDQELVTCYEIGTGRLLWSHAESTGHGPDPLGDPGPRATPTVVDGRLYAVGGTGRVLCLDAATGEQLWRHDLWEELGLAWDNQKFVVAWGRAASPLVTDGLCVVPGGGTKDGPKVSLFAFDAATGEERWRAGDDQVSYASPVAMTLAGRRQIVSVNESTVTGHDIPTGAILWTFDWPGNSAMNASASQPIPVGADGVLVSKGYGGGAKLVRLTPPADDATLPWTGATVWENKRAFKTKFSSAVPAGETAFALSDTILQAVRLATGEITARDGRFGHGQLLRVGETLLILSEEGDLVAVDADPRELTELARLRVLDGKTWSHLCLTGDRLLIRNSREAACFRLPVRPVAP